MFRRDTSVKLGVVYTRRDVNGKYFCNTDIAQQAKQQIENKLKELKVDFVNINFLNEEGIIFEDLDASKVADYMIVQKIDALFVPHVNFGAEAAVAKVAQRVGKPVLLWAPRDESPILHNGNRCTDSQCGLMATGKILRDFGVKFTYMTNCNIDDETFTRGIDNFLSTVCVVKAMTHLRIGQIGTRPSTFWSVKCNELQLLERYGIEIEPITMIELKQRFDAVMTDDSKLLDEAVKYYKANFEVIVSDDSLRRTAALTKAIEDFAVDRQLSAIASSCWGPMRSIGGVASCFAFSELTDHNLPVVCETDIHGAITSVMAQAATRWNMSSFFADITIRHPENDNAELFWHCGVFPRSTAKDTPTIGTIFDEHRPTVNNLELKQNTPVTLTRFDCSRDQYSLLIAEGKTVSGPPTSGTYGWIQFHDWPKLEHKIVAGPYVHHVAGVEAQVGHVLYEACKYIPGLTPDVAEPTAEELEARLR